MQRKDMPISFEVSTHSRLKAAGADFVHGHKRPICFNTQPPEGGWSTQMDSKPTRASFNTQPPEGGW